MSIYVVKIPRSIKDHLAGKRQNGTYWTICGKEVPVGSAIIETAPRYSFCVKCYQYIGREMVSEFLGADCYGDYSVRCVKKSEEAQS